MRKVELASDQRRFTMIYNDFLENRVLSATEKLVFIFLKMFTGQKTSCYPSVKTLASKMSISENTTRKALLGLKAKGIIQILPRFDQEGQHSNLYIIHDTKELWECQSEEEMIQIKEKALCAPTQTGQVDKAHSSADDTNTETAQSQYRYSMEDIKSQYGYEEILAKTSMDLATLAMQTLFDFLNVTHDITIKGQIIKLIVLNQKLFTLDQQDIIQALGIYSSVKEPIINPKAYLLTILLSVAGGKSKIKAPADSKNRFTKFEQRAYDFGSLEESLLNHT